MPFALGYCIDCWFSIRLAGNIPSDGSCASLGNGNFNQHARCCWSVLCWQLIVCLLVMLDVMLHCLIRPILGLLHAKQHITAWFKLTHAVVVCPVESYPVRNFPDYYRDIFGKLALKHAVAALFPTFSRRPCTLDSLVTDPSRWLHCASENVQTCAIEMAKIGIQSLRAKASKGMGYNCKGGGITGLQGDSAQQIAPRMGPDVLDTPGGSAHRHQSCTWCVERCTVGD